MKQAIHINFSFLTFLRLLFVVLMALAALTASAQDSFKDAKTALNAGKKLLEQGQPQEALEIFRLGYAQFNEPEFIFFSADALLKLQKYQEAKDAFENYLKLQPKSKNKAEINGLIKELTRILSTKIKLSSQPSGAAFWYDYQEGPSKGITPTEVPIPPGSHTIILQKSGYGVTKVTVEIEEGKTTTLDVSMQDEPVKLNISTEPKGAQVFLDGTQVGVTPYKGEITSGKHSIVLKKDGFGNVSLTINDPPGKERNISEKMPPPGGTVLFSNIEPGSTLTVNDQTNPLTERLELPSGEHLIYIEAPGFRPIKSRIQVNSGKELLINARLQPKGVSLALQSSAQGATLLLNGKAQTLPVFIKEGDSATIEVTKEGFKPYKKKIDAKDGDYVLEVKFREPGIPLGPTALLATSLALSGAGGAYGLLAIKHKLEFKQSPTKSQFDQITLEENLSNIGLGAGSVALLGSVIWLRKVGGFRHSPGKLTEQVAILPTTNGAVAQVAF